MIETQSNEPYFLAVHSQSNRSADQPLGFEGVRPEEAYASRALCLDNQIACVMPWDTEPSYLKYMQGLGINVPPIVVPSLIGRNLSERLAHDEKSLQEIQRLGSGKNLVLSTFDVTPSEIHLLDALKNRELSIVLEENPELAAILGNKAGFREWCKEEGLPQLPGGVFRSANEMALFAEDAIQRVGGVVAKDPLGTAGVGVQILTDTTQITKSLLESWETTMNGGRPMIAEWLASGGTEHAAHVYIDPLSGEVSLRGPYNQIVKQEGEGLAFYGSSYPVVDAQVQQEILDLFEKQVVPSLLRANYTGYASFDILHNPLPGHKMHLMELNARTGATGYINEITRRVCAALYPKADMTNFAFMLLSSLPHNAQSFQEFAHTYADILTPDNNNGIIFTNPLRHQFGSYDITAFSLNGPEAAQEKLQSAMLEIWGPAKTEQYFQEIYQR